MDVVARALDNLKNSGFYWASRSGVTVAVSDIATPAEKPAIMERYESRLLQFRTTSRSVPSMTKSVVRS